MTPFELGWAKTFQHEQGFSNDPQDSGGATRFGITERVARANGYTGDMRALPLEKAREIARRQYWSILSLDDVARESLAIALEMFDTGYNCGVGNAGRWLQKALNAFNKEGTAYADLTEDGNIGPVTVSALGFYLRWRRDRGEMVMLRALNSLQGAYYLGLSSSRPKDEKYVFGWFERVSI